MKRALQNGRIFFNNTILDNHTVVLEGEQIIDVCTDHSQFHDIDIYHDLNGQLLSPGFIDIQVNGGGGLLFNDEPNIRSIRIIAEAHRQFGTTGFLPTLISDDLSTIERAINVVRQAIEQETPGVLGIHLEGPFLNPSYKGVHDESKFRTIDENIIDLLTSFDNGVLLMTLAPECTSPEVISRLYKAGIIVSAGHTAANYEEINTALDAGLTGFTHLFNAMTPLRSREPGVVGAALLDQESYCGLIVDGFHVHPATLRLVLSSKPHSQLILVTDAMAIVGSPVNTFNLNGEIIECVDGRCTTKDGTLAGSSLNMASAVANMVELVGAPVESALTMASHNPATFLGLQDNIGKIAPNYLANLVVLDDKWSVISVWYKGNIVFEQ